VLVSKALFDRCISPDDAFSPAPARDRAGIAFMSPRAANSSPLCDLVGRRGQFMRQRRNIGLFVNPMVAPTRNIHQNGVRDADDRPLPVSEAQHRV
jgi:hypothetical protein